MITNRNPPFGGCKKIKASIMIHIDFMYYAGALRKKGRRYHV